MGGGFALCGAGLSVGGFARIGARRNRGRFTKGKSVTGKPWRKHGRVLHEQGVAKRGAWACVGAVICGRVGVMYSPINFARRGRGFMYAKRGGKRNGKARGVLPMLCGGFVAVKSKGAGLCKGKSGARGRLLWRFALCRGLCVKRRGGGYAKRQNGGAAWRGKAWQARRI